VYHLRGLTGLQELTLEDAQVTDAGLAYLRGLTSLASLDLTGTQITDAGLEDLKGLTTLHLLDLRDTRLTNEGIRELQEALPKCELYTGHRLPNEALRYQGGQR
jgi:Leucine-rich repeat (LRR) protein